MRKASSAPIRTTAATNRKPSNESPRCLRPDAAAIPFAAMIPSLTNAATDPLETKARDIVPIEPDEEGLAAYVVVRDEPPIATVVAVVPVVAHHEIVTGRHLAGKA